MSSITGTTGMLAQARAAVSQGHWAAALDLLAAADGDEADSHEGLETFATAAYGAGNLEAAVSALEDLHAAHVRGGDPVAAARADRSSPASAPSARCPSSGRRRGGGARA